MIDKALLAKILKCLALAKSANEHEAAAALAKARALMDEHGVTDDQLTMADIEEATARASRTQKPPKWENYLCAAVRRALGVIAFINGDGDRTYIGRGAAPEIATYAFTVLFRQLKAARAEYIRVQLRRCKPGRKRQRADIFCEGWAATVYRKISELMPKPPADETLERYLAEQHTDLVPIGARGATLKGRAAFDDFLRGCQSGSAVDLHQGVGAAAAPLAIA